MANEYSKTNSCQSPVALRWIEGTRILVLWMNHIAETVFGKLEAMDLPYWQSTNR